MDLSYFNARIRGMRAGLFKKADYSAMLDLRTEKELVDRLRSSAYGPFMESALIRYTTFDTAVEAAFIEGLGEAFAELKRHAPPEAAGLIGLFFVMQEAADVKAMVRGIARGAKRDSIAKTLVPAGQIDDRAIKLLLGAKDVEEAARYLSTWGSPFGAAITEGIAEFKKNNDLALIETNIDRTSFRLLKEGCKMRGLDGRIMRESVERSIDAANAKTLVKISGEGYATLAASGLFIEGGRAFAKKAYLRLIEIIDRDELISRLADAIKDPAIASVLDSSHDEPALLEERLDAISHALFRRYSVVEPLGIALGAAYASMKIREVKNLRLVARAKSFAIPKEEIGRFIISAV